MTEESTLLIEGSVLQVAALPRLDRSAIPLEDKVHAAVRFMEQILEDASPAEVAVAWTGGKDSTVALALYRECLRRVSPEAPVRAISIDTGCKFPQVMALRDEVAALWGVNVRVQRPEVDIARYPVAKDKVACCRDLKVRPLQTAIRESGIRYLLTGIRADEHGSRQSRSEIEIRTHPVHILAHPVLDFTEMDIWAYIMDRGIPYCSLYADGYRSLGCVPCTALGEAGGSERAGRDAEKEKNLDLLHSLGYF